MVLNRSQEMIERDIKKKRNKNNDKKYYLEGLYLDSYFLTFQVNIIF